MDIVGASLGLVLSSVPMAVTALLVRKELGSPVLFRQTRPGRDGKPFEMLKFRTMGSEVDERGEPLPDSKRLGKIGSLLREASLDELPGLWNVLRGDMSLIGPRPLLMRYTEYFTETELARLDVKPGITGWAQVNGRNTVSWDRRLEYDTWYVKHQSIMLDFRILFMTVAKVFRRQGVIVDPRSVMLDLDQERSRRGSK
ncbi:sugar transferase [Arthrobacter sp. FW306-07-I]|nr:sugar transferase [Arthrobacter sp. FW306-07-I]